MTFLDALSSGQLLGLQRPLSKLDGEALPSQHPLIISPQLLRLQNRNAAQIGLILPGADSREPLFAAFKPLLALSFLLNPRALLQFSGRQFQILQAFQALLQELHFPAIPARVRAHSGQQEERSEKSGGLTRTLSAAKDGVSDKAKALRKELQETADQLKELAKPVAKQARVQIIEVYSKARATLPEDLPLAQHGEKLVERSKLFMESLVQDYHAWMQEEGRPQEMTRALVDWIVHGELPKQILDLIAWFQQITPYLLALAYAQSNRWNDMTRKRLKHPCKQCKQHECECEEDVLARYYR